MARLPATEADSLTFPICFDGTYQNQRIVGSFHTHPNIGPEWQQEPSEQDVLVSIEYPETMGPHHFVVARDTVYHIDNQGCVSEVGATSQILQFPAGGST